VLKGGDGPDVFVFGRATCQRSPTSAGCSARSTRRTTPSPTSRQGSTRSTSARSTPTRTGTATSARHTVVKGDTDGDGAYDVLIVLKGHHHLHAGRLHPLTLAGNGRRSPCARALDYTDWSAASDPRRRRRRSDQSRHRRASPCAEESLK
jgi:hypothetical protein